MADETTIYRDQLVKTAGDDDSPKISVLTQKISDLQSENARIVQQNEDYRQKIDELEETVKIAGELERTTDDLNRRLGVLERDVAGIDRDYADLERGRRNFMKNWEEMKEIDKVIYDEFNTMTVEIYFLLAKVRKLEEKAISLRCESDEKEEEIQMLKRELEVVLESNKALEKSRRGSEKMAEQLTDKITALEIGLADKKKVITESEEKEREVA